MMIEDRFFDQEWVQELNDSDFRMLIYLLHCASKKTGAVELNMRQLNFMANTATRYTKEDVLEKFGNMIRLIPGKENTAIFPDYISTNWAKGGKPIDTQRNPLFKSIVAELKSFGLTIDDVNAMAKQKVWVKESEEVEDVHTDVVDTGNPVLSGRQQGLSDADAEQMCNAFWEAYPKNCPRKVDKKKCFSRLTHILRDAKDSVKKFNDIMAGLEVWKKCDTWSRNNGEFIRAPLVWINNESWNDKPMGVIKNGSNNGNATYKSAVYSDAF